MAGRSVSRTAPAKTVTGNLNTTAASTAKMSESRASTLSAVTAASSRINDAKTAVKRKASGAATSKSKVASTNTSTKSSAVTSGFMKPAEKTCSPSKKGMMTLDLHDNEPIKAFLRIRPVPEDSAKTDEEPYIDVISETEVLMSPPKSSTAVRARVYSTVPPTKYAFSRVFPGETSEKGGSQPSFFKETTLPLVEELLQGQSGLIFTYGVTNSGKSYTVQGGQGSQEAGILPRSMDTIFNSIKGLESDSNIRPTGLSGIELGSEDNMSPGGINPFSLPALSKKIPVNHRPAQYDHDPTKIRVDRNYRYSVWVSYVEVYNEKIFDLLDAAPPASQTPRASTFGGGMSRSDSFRGANWTLAPTSDSGPIYLQRKPLTLKNDVENGGKYVAGLQEIRVRSAEEARELLQRGQENRQVFGTMANRASSRSHGVFTVRLIREHAGETDMTVAFSTSRLSIVDLAGSERLGNTSVTGDRLKEAGSINKSLMCLGQCLETLRKNQARAASFVPMPSPISSTANSSIQTAANRILKRRPSIVPFRHSKLTELFQSFFTGEGRAVMIVNVNPFDTGFDENSHVMRFSAAAKEVQTIRSQSTTTNLSRFVHPSLRDLFNPSASPAPSPGPKKAMAPPPTSKAPAQIKSSAPSTIAASKAAKSKPQAVKGAPTPASIPQEVTIIEENDDDDAEQSDSFVDHLMAKYEEVRHRLYQSERQCALIEAQVREEMAAEMSRRLQEMESMFFSRIVQDSSQHDDFINRKLDLIGKSPDSDLSDEEDDNDDEGDTDDQEVEESLPSREGLSKGSKSVESERDESSILRSRPKRKSAAKRVISMSEDDDEEDEDEDEDGVTRDESSLQDEEVSVLDPDIEVTAEEIFSSDEEEDEEEEEEDGEEDSSDNSFDVSQESIESSFEAPPKRTSRGRVSKAAAPKRPLKAAARKQPPPPPISRKSTNGLPLMEKSANMSLDNVDNSSDSSLVLAEKPAKSPKKKRLLAKKAVLNQEMLMDGMESEG